MNLRVLAIIIILSLCFFFGFKKISAIRNENINATIEELKILDYIPKDNKLLFISNCKSSKFIDNLRKELSKENLNKIFLIRNSILAYLGIDIGDNKIEDIYNSELAISTYENDKNTKDDILIIFKIKPDKKINDLLNIQNNFDQSDEIIPIYRENKLNYLNYIYKTKDDYIISSSNKNLILDSLRSNSLKDKNQEFSRQIMINLKNQDAILLSKNFENNFFSNKKIFPDINNEDIIATTFTIKIRI